MTFSERIKKIDINYVVYGLLIIFFLFMLYLSSFRDMIKDESLYFHETYLMSELFKQGKWIGNYAVGLHGFLFKIPPALVFLLTGPSVTVVTVYHILLATLFIYLFYRVSNIIFKKKIYSLLSTLIVISMFHFFSSVPTFLREIPMMLSVLLFMYALLKDWRKGYVSLVFLLLLDAKEYVFFGFALFYIIWLFIDSDKRGIKRIISVVRDCSIVLLPSVMWIVLMFSTGIVPVNMFLASTIGIIDKNFDYLLASFSVDSASLNLLEGGRDMPLFTIREIWHPLFRSFVTVVNVVLMYIGKILYPRTFSFISIPKVVIFPVVYTSILSLRKYFRKRRESIKYYATISLLFLVWLVICIARASHGRYLLPVLPAISTLYIYTLFKYRYTRKQREVLLLGTLIFVILGFLFETTYVPFKIAIELLLFLFLCFSLLKPQKSISKYIGVVLLSSVSIGVSILFSYTQGQIYGYMNWGKNRSVEEVSKIVPPEGRYWINNDTNQYLLSVYTGETYAPVEWKWNLDEWIPRRQNLKSLGEKRSFVFPVSSLEEFRSNLEEYSIGVIVFMESTIKNSYYPNQEYLDIFLRQDWIELEQRYTLQGVNIYIFNVK